MGTVRRLESWPFSYFSASLAVHIMLIMSGEGSDALRLIRLKFYGTLAGTSEANTSFPNQALINSRKWFFTLKEPENPHTVRVSKKRQRAVWNIIRLGTPYDRSTSRTWTTFNFVASASQQYDWRWLERWKHRVTCRRKQKTVLAPLIAKMKSAFHSLASASIFSVLYRNFFCLSV